jgi:hypothetical protein
MRVQSSVSVATNEYSDIYGGMGKQLPKVGRKTPNFGGSPQDHLSTFLGVFFHITPRAMGVVFSLAIWGSCKTPLLLGFTWMLQEDYISYPILYLV